MLHDFLDRGEIVIPAAVGAGKMEDIPRPVGRFGIDISGADPEGAAAFNDLRRASGNRIFVEIVIEIVSRGQLFHGARIAADNVTG